MQLEEVTLNTLAKGGAQERFEDALADVLKNIRDPNRDWKKKRRITLTVDFIPKENRAEADIVTEAKCTLVPMTPIVSTMFFGVKDGMMHAAEVRQDELFTYPPEKKIYGLKKEGE